MSAAVPIEKMSEVKHGRMVRLAGVEYLKESLKVTVEIDNRRGHPAEDQFLSTAIPPSVNASSGKAG